MITTALEPFWLVDDHSTRCRADLDPRRATFMFLVASSLENLVFFSILLSLVMLLFSPRADPHVWDA